MTLHDAAARLSVWLRTVIGRNSLRAPQSDFSPPQIRLLDALQRGDTLKSHRYLDGGKEYRLHPLDGEAVSVPAEDVRPLVDRGLLLSNPEISRGDLVPVRPGPPRGSESEGSSRYASPSRDSRGPLTVGIRTTDSFREASGPHSPQASSVSFSSDKVTPSSSGVSPP